MNPRTTYILGGVFLAMLMLVALAVFWGPANPEQGRHVFPAWHASTALDANPADSVLRVRIERTEPAAETIEFAREGKGGAWRIGAPMAAAGDNFSIGALVRAIVEARREDDREVTGSASTLGLDKPVATITLTDAAGTERTLKVGRTIPGATTQQTAVESSERPGKPVIVARRDIADIFKPLSALRDRSLVASTEADIDFLEVAEGKKGPVSLRKKDGRWRYVAPDLGPADSGDPAAQTTPGGSADVGSILRDIVALRVEQAGERAGERNDFVADGVKDAAAYGLDPAKGRVLRLKVDRAETVKVEGGTSEAKVKTVTLLVGLDKKEEIKPQGTPPAGAPFSGYPAMLEGSGSVARVPAKPVEALLKLVEAPDMLRDRALTRLSAEPDVIEIRNGLGAFELLRPSAGTWQLWKAGAKEPLAADTTAVASLVEAFRKERVSFVEGDPKAREKELDLDKPADRQVSVTFRLAGILADAPKPDEKKDAPAGKPRVREAKPDAVIVFGKRLGEEVAARRSWGDDTALVKAGKGLLDLVEQGSLSYLEKRLPPLAASTTDLAGEALAVSVAHADGTVELAREAKDKPWAFSQPADRKALPVGPDAAKNLASALSGLPVRRWIAEQPAAAQLESFGLAKPRLTVTITLPGKDGKKESAAAQFGADISDKGEVYARIVGSDRVFATDKAALVPLQAPLEDRVPFAALDAKKVAHLKITGWQGINGTPVTLEVERKDGGWVAKDPPKDFPVAAAKVDALLESIKSLRVDKFAKYSGGPDASHEIDPAKNGMRIEWTAEGKSEPSFLSLGKVDGSMLHATASRYPGAVILVPKAPFDEPMQGRAKFKQ